jgi:Xaa-Pro aminopeptidase
MALWEHGFDYNHGTGHGVGCFLNVHEGPQSIRNRLPEKKSDAVELKPGMVLSDEPGLYLPGEYGIRLENMMVVTDDQKTEFGEFLRFETLTLVPFDPAAIEWSLLTEREKEVLNAYHDRILREIGPLLPEEDLLWLKNKLRKD